MSVADIAVIVEGKGEVESVPILLRRIAAEIAPDVSLNIPRPIRIRAAKELAADYRRNP